MVHPYIPNSVPDIKRRMMAELGIKFVEDLYSDIPEEIRLKRRLNIPGPLSEMEVRRTVSEKLGKNVRLKAIPFLGAGVWPHYVPAVVEEVVSRLEFLTAYTPYQPEVSQGLCQALFEYQSLICELTGMDVANCSLYDWASALGEAARMAARLTHRRVVVAPKIIHPERLETLRTYVEPAGMSVVQVGYDRETGLMDLSELEGKVSGETAAVYVENPTYLGFIETQVDEISDIAHRSGALLIVGVDPISLGILRPPGDYGADIVVGEGQPLGNHPNYGGPLLGIFACRGDMRFVRQMPGRIIGMTVDSEGRRAFCMALQTREQHIRRERATSNVCTNEALCAVAAAVYLSLLGPKGLRRLCEVILSLSHYAMKRLSELEGVEAPLFRSAHFKEFTVGFRDARVDEVNKALIERGFHGGKPISREFPELGEAALYCVTEVHSKRDIDGLVEALREVLEA